MEAVVEVYINKADNSLKGAQSELVNGRFDNCANRCYYACFQAAIAALLRAGIRPTGQGQWGHDFVQAQFAGQLVGRRKLYPSSLRDTLTRLHELRQKADYAADHVIDVQATRVVRRAEEFVAAVEAAISEGGDER